MSISIRLPVLLLFVLVVVVVNVALRENPIDVKHDVSRLSLVFSF